MVARQHFILFVSFCNFFLTFMKMTGRILKDDLSNVQYTPSSPIFKTSSILHHIFIANLLGSPGKYYKNACCSSKM